VQLAPLPEVLIEVLIVVLMNCCPAGRVLGSSWMWVPPWKLAPLKGDSLELRMRGECALGVVDRAV